MNLNRFPQNNREKLVVPRRRYVHILGHIAEANVTFRGKGGTAEHVTDFVFKIGTKRSLFRRRRGDPMWSPVYIPQYKKRKKHRLRVTPSFAWAQFVHSALFFQSPAVARTCSLLKRQQAVVLNCIRRFAYETVNRFYPHRGIKSHAQVATFTVAHTCSLSNAKQALRLVAFGALLTKCVAFLPS